MHLRSGVGYVLLMCMAGTLWSACAQAQSLDPLTAGICSGQIYGGTTAMAAGFKQMGLCNPQSQANAGAAAKIAAIQNNLKNNTQLTNNIAGLFLGILQSDNDGESNGTSAAAAVDRARAVAAADAARRLQQAILQANAILEAANTADAAPRGANAAINSLLSADHPRNSTDAAINTLLGGRGTAAPHVPSKTSSADATLAPSSP